MSVSNASRAATLLLAPLLLVAGAAMARQGERPLLLDPARADARIERIVLPGIDAAALRRSHDFVEKSALPAVIDKRLAISTGQPTLIDPRVDGRWQQLDDGRQLWQFAVDVPGATDLHLGFERYRLPEGARMWVVGATGYYEGPYDAQDGEPLWLPMIPGASAHIELQLPPGVTPADLDLVLTEVGAGFRDLFGLAKLAGPQSSGACNINVVCPLGQPYSDEQRALAYYEFRGDNGIGYICTGTMLNSAATTPRAYVLTAAHCMSTASEVASMRVYWNYRSAQCSPTSGWSLAQNQTGASLRATRADVDFSLVELNAAPDPAWRIFFAGWDATGIAPGSSIGLHHPRGDVAKVTASNMAPRTTNNCIGTGGTSFNTHWLSGPYQQGTTEGGSSGSGLWIPAGEGGGTGKRLIGMLSGGNADCSTGNPTQPNGGIDCYGKMSAAWDGSSAGTRLRDWLDPGATGTRSLAGRFQDTPFHPIPPGLQTRLAADRQAPAMRASGRGTGQHPIPFDPRTRVD